MYFNNRHDYSTDSYISTPENLSSSSRESSENFLSARSYMQDEPSDQDTDSSESPADVNENEMLIESLDVCLKENTENHHTDKFHDVKKPKPTLVVRRGQEFRIIVTFKKKVRIQKLASISFFAVKTDVDKPERVTGGVYIFNLSLTRQTSSTNWVANLDAHDNISVTILVTAPANCFVGKWRVKIGGSEDGRSFSYSSQKLVMYLLFNPWCKEDQVYLEENEARNAYIFEETGMVFYGSCSNENKDSISTFPWEYAQFAKNILRCSFYIIQNLKQIDVTKLGDAVHIARTLSSLGSAEKTPQVIIGRWDGRWRGGTNPMNWKSSKEILDTFWLGKKAAKWGQCWVFAGVATTISRAIGIPSRVICGYDVGRNKNSETDMTIEEVTDQTGTPLEDDFLWSFHVWSECWLKRTDLNYPAYNGWQMIDPTPMVISTNGEYCLGPIPVVAIKNGDVETPYDGNYLYSEINGDRVFWEKVYNTPLKLLRIAKDNVGRCISTKKIGIMEREEITDNYKFPEKSPEEREANRRALAHSKIPDADKYLIKKMEGTNLKVQIEIEPKTLLMGKQFEVIGYTEVLLNDKSNVNKEIILKLRVEYKSNLRINSFPVKDQSITATIKPKKVEVFRIKVEFEDYKNIIKGNIMGIFRVGLLGYVQSVDYEFYTEQSIALTSPLLQVGDKSEFDQVEIFFNNPLPYAVSGKFGICGPGTKINMNARPANPDQKAVIIFSVKKAVPPAIPTYSINFMSRYIEGVKGSLSWKNNKWQID